MAISKTNIFHNLVPRLRKSLGTRLYLPWGVLNVVYTV
jgi:hypothetical protein